MALIKRSLGPIDFIRLSKGDVIDYHEHDYNVFSCLLWGYFVELILFAEPTPTHPCVLNTMKHRNYPLNIGYLKRGRFHKIIVMENTWLINWRI